MLRLLLLATQKLEISFHHDLISVYASCLEIYNPWLTNSWSKKTSFCICDFILYCPAKVFVIRYIRCSQVLLRRNRKCTLFILITTWCWLSLDVIDNVKQNYDSNQSITRCEYVLMVTEGHKRDDSWQNRCCVEKLFTTLLFFVNPANNLYNK